MNLQNLLGLNLSQAENIMTNKGIKYIIKETLGFKDKELLTIPRVVKAVKNEDTIELVITYFSSPLN